MSFITENYADENNPRFTDTDQMIEYHFIGFDSPLTEEEKKKLIQKYGRARHKPLSPPAIGNEFVAITLPEREFEFQVIHKLIETDEEKS